MHRHVLTVSERNPAFHSLPVRRTASSQSDRILPADYESGSVSEAVGPLQFRLIR